MSKIRTFLNLSNREKWFFAQALLLIPFCQCCVKLLPFSTIIRLFKLKPCSSAGPIASQYKEDVEKVTWAIHVVQKRFSFIPGRCLAQALTAKILLARIGCKCTIFLGARLEDKQKLSAHAWTYCGDRVVTGGAGIGQHKELIRLC